MSFDTFWADPRIPPEMKRCGKPPVRNALAKASVDCEIILQSIEQYAANKEDWRAFCHLSVFINQERFDVDHAATSEPVKEDYGFQISGGEGPNLTAFIVNGIWRDEWGERPGSIEAAKARLDEINAPRYGLKVVK